MNQRNRWTSLTTTLSRRSLAIAGSGGIVSLRATHQSSAATPVPNPTANIVIDLGGEPESIDPALAYSPIDWSIVHAIFEAPIGFSEDGTLVPLAAESFTNVDPLTWEAKLRTGLTFHDGSSVTSAALTRSLTHIRNSGSLAAEQFAGITSIDIVDELTARIGTGEPSPWLPAQIAVWMVLLPEGFSAESAQSSPVGSGPFRFLRYDRGVEIALARFDDYATESSKGVPIAEAVTYRFVPEPSTRVADLNTGAAQIIADLPRDQFDAVNASDARVVETSIVGSAWIRIASDVKPFDDPLVRLALNHAVDVENIAQALVSPDAHRLASLFPDQRSIGFDPELKPFAFDVERARTLLADAGYADGFDTELEITTGSGADVAEAITSQLAEIGCRCTIVVSDSATFNASWKDPAAPALRMATWSPLFEPQTLLGLVFQSSGFLSRYSSPEADALMTAAAAEPDPAKRAATYRRLAQVMCDDPPALFLWNLTSAYGVSDSVKEWTARGDEYLLPMAITGRNL